MKKRSRKRFLIACGLLLVACAILFIWLRSLSRTERDPSVDQLNSKLNTGIPRSSEGRPYYN